MIEFGSTLNQPICFILDASKTIAKESSPNPPVSDPKKEAGKEEAEGEAAVHIDQTGWWPDPKIEENKPRTLKRTSYLFKLKTEEKFNKEVYS